MLKESDDFQDGSYILLLPNPVKGGNYSCEIPQLFRQEACLSAGTDETVRDTIVVDEVSGDNDDNLEDDRLFIPVLRLVLLLLQMIPTSVFSASVCELHLACCSVFNQSGEQQTSSPHSSPLRAFQVKSHLFVEGSSSMHLCGQYTQNSNIGFAVPRCGHLSL